MLRWANNSGYFNFYTYCGLHEFDTTPVLLLLPEALEEVNIDIQNPL